MNYSSQNVLKWVVEFETNLYRPCKNYSHISLHAPGQLQIEH